MTAPAPAGGFLDVLGDVRVVELATGIAGPYAGKLFADAGADVVKVEPPGGDPLRARPGRPGGGTGLLFAHLNAGKRSVVGSPGDGHVAELVAGAHLVIESTVPAAPEVEAWRRDDPSLVVLSVTPHGRVGPWRDRPASGFTVQAASGSLGSRGRPGGVPFQVGGRVGEWAAGVYGAVGALGALVRARATGHGEHVDAPWILADHMSTNPNAALRHQLQGSPPLEGTAQIVDVPSIEPTADGFVGVNTNTRQQFEDLLRLVGREDLLADERWASAEHRMRHLDEWNDATRPWFRLRTTQEVLQAASGWRIPVAPVHSGATLAGDEQFRARGIFAPLPGHDALHPLPPYRLEGVRPRPRGAAPALDEHRDDTAPRPGTAPGRPWPLRFEGLRVLDVTSMWAGPVVGQVLAALGADVVHVESIQRLDLGRLKVDAAYGLPQWWERAPNWFMVNTDKRDLTLDLSSPRGQELMRALLPHCDVLVENFSPRVFDHFGLTEHEVRALNPDIVFARMPAFGLDGPWRDNVGFAQTMEQASGMAWVTGHVEDEGPSVPRGPCDPLAGFHALFAVLVALWKRARGGGGSFLELAMAESALNVTAELVLEHSGNATVLERTGNRGPDAAPQGLYRCGDGAWLAVSIGPPEQWRAAVAVLGPPSVAGGDLGELDDLARRHAVHDALDAWVGGWAAGRDAPGAADELVRAGVPAATLTDPRRAHEHPQLAALGYFEAVEHPVVGTHLAPSLPFRYRSVPRWVRKHSPLLGQHNGEVLGGILGLGPEELARLERDGVIGDRPLGSNPAFDL